MVRVGFLSRNGYDGGWEWQWTPMDTMEMQYRTERLYGEIQNGSAITFCGTMQMTVGMEEQQPEWKDCPQE